ncbi:MAG: hypothetical protein Q8S73_37040 [Deltaproteobacteria bacterium]|nr:hypothetical protein [Myxococcales bacterium]MDP3219767.1 hypothetical protein [Deltaproteobacteria bacterium]
MTDRLRTVGYVLGYASALGALVAGCALAPRATGAVVVVGVGYALRWVLRMPAVTP